MFIQSEVTYPNSSYPNTSVIWTRLAKPHSVIPVTFVDGKQLISSVSGLALPVVESGNASHMVTAARQQLSASAATHSAHSSVMWANIIWTPSVMLQLSEHFSYPNTLWSQHVRISDLQLYMYLDHNWSALFQVQPTCSGIKWERVWHLLSCEHNVT